ncbi:hypothetical protein Poli38472_003693 [Pythium oligandrum]|uniref:Regulator of telomere elongation helicase 1 homolog n=1 Tax=Pythium oligandrum TaxID=41045 RepID=A0A8K1CN35_PYTOL|nr:hypothetical protein Poli38472_003693 [Pythium oligandrum]|eukprot:TMW65928.1 hypothetical protein Poli38472_003693 [Pythium oligandrum]
MVRLEICGLPVEFPFQPYDSQLIYMEKVVASLLSKQNAILESPTGTGKTLCLLCATLAWRQHVKKTMKKQAPASGSNLGYEVGSDGEEVAQEVDDQIPRIIYSSRTHSQLKQVIQELKNTAYKPRVAVLGSREHLCVNEKVSQLKGTRQNLACRSVVKNRRCGFKKGFDEIKARNKKVTLPIMDIEELVEHTKQKKVCPFFLSRTMLPDADIIFVPYNYLIDPLARRSIGISLENAVLIFDEAHNVESIASDAASYALSSNDIAGCVAEVQQFINALSEHRIVLPPNSTVSAESAQTLKALLLEIDKGLNAFPLSSSGGYTKPGEFIFDFFQQFNVNFDTCPLVLGMVEEIIEVMNQGDDQRTAASKLDALLSFVGTIFRNKDKHMAVAKNYRVHIQEIQERGSSKNPRLFNSSRQGKTRVFNYWCFHPGVSFEEIAANNVYNIVLTSGTLSPLETTIKELGIEFPVRLENNHVIDAEQVWVGVVGKGVTGKRLNSSYNFRSTEEYLVELGNTIVNFARLVPKGLLVFFPSYGILEESVGRWQKPTSKESTASIWDRLLQLKEIYVEPRDRLEFKIAVNEYDEAIKNNASGAIFFAVCRGKVSEGIDFSNDKGRAVVITGLPFPPTKDPKIVLKKSILDEAVVGPGELKLTGNHWYIQQASRAVNQAIGRVIRHRHDYGAIILCDERFALQQQQKCLSKWLQPYCRSYQGYGEAHIGLLRFFKGNQANQQAAITVTKKLEVTNGPPNTKFKPPIRRTEEVVKEKDAAHADFDSAGNGIGDGQSYVNPELLRQPPKPAPAPEKKPSMTPTYNKPVVPPRKRTLGSVLTSSRSAMVESTASIARPFVPPRVHIESTEATQVNVTETSTDANEGAPFSTSVNPVAAFPTVARSVLSPADVKRLYAIIRQLHSGENVDTIMKELCDLLREPDRQSLLELMPKVLNDGARERFVETATALGLNVHGDTVANIAVQSTTSARGSSGMASFFERLQQNKRRKQHGHEHAVAVVKDPQCVVCYEITRKAYASSCGHICCLPCWQKMEKDGFTACPMCKLPFKLDQLSLIRAAKTRDQQVAPRE